MSEAKPYRLTDTLPWSVRQGGDNGNDPNAHDVVNALGGKVAHLPWSREEDARLIAAAPELWAALRALVSATDEDTEVWRVARHLFDTARAALAKAEGKP